MKEKAIIETLMPLKTISTEARKEKSRKPKNISTMHIYWARRPTIASRAAILGALLPSGTNDGDYGQKYWEVLINACTWKFTENPGQIKEIRALLKKITNQSSLRMIDIFAGGGSIPLEGIRLGLETWAVDVNPIAHLIQKGILEYPQKFGKKLIKLFEEWLTTVGKKAESELKELYQSPSRDKIPHAYIWAKVIRCPNKTCQVKIPLIKQFWLANKKNKKIALKPMMNAANKTLTFTIVRDENIDFNPQKGTIQRGKVKCWNCQAIIDNKHLKILFQQNKVTHDLLAIAFKERGSTWYDLPTPQDLRGYEIALRKLATWQDEILPNGLSLIPREEAPPKEALGCSTAHYGLTTWDKFFNARQLASMLTFVRLIIEAQEEMTRQGYNDDLRKAISLYLSFVLNRIADYNNILCTWHNRSENIGHMFTRPVLTMRWDYAEINPLNSRASSWWSFGRAILKVLDHLTSIECKPAHLILGSATRLPFRHDFFDLVVTDPPFYDNISYSDLSDFFYVWFKRTIGHLFPDILKWPLTPKRDEIIHSPCRHESKEQSRQFYTTLLTKAFKEAHRVLKDEGTCIIMFTHKNTDAWISLLSSIREAGFQVVATWPLRMEMTARMRAMKSAAVNTTILIACRKASPKHEITFANEFKERFTKELSSKLEYFWKQGIKGVDFFISAIGPAMAMFNNYGAIFTTSGREMSLKELLDLTSEVCFKFMLERTVNKSALASMDHVTAFYVTWRILQEQDVMEYDAANKLAKVFQLELSELETLGLIKKERQHVQLVSLHMCSDDKLQNSPNFTKIPLIMILITIIAVLRRNTIQELKTLIAELKNHNGEIYQRCVRLAQALIETEHTPPQDKRDLHLMLSTIQVLEK